VAAEGVKEVEAEAPEKDLEGDEAGGEFFAEDGSHDARAVESHVENDRESESGEPAHAEADFWPKGVVGALVTGREDRIHGLDEGVGKDDGDEDEHGGGVVIGDVALGAQFSDEEDGEIEMECGEEVDDEEEAGVEEQVAHAGEGKRGAQAGMALEEDEGSHGELEGGGSGEDGGDPADIVSEAEEEEAGGSVEEFAGEGEGAVPVMFLEGAEEGSDGEVPGVEENPRSGPEGGLMEDRVINGYEDDPAEGGGEEREEEFKKERIPEIFRRGGWMAGDIADEEGPEAEFAEDVEDDGEAEGEGEAAVLFIADDFDEGGDEEEGNELGAGLAGEEGEGVAEDAVGIHGAD